MNINKPEVLRRAWGEEVIVAETKIHACKILKRKPHTESASRGFQLHVKEESHFLYQGRMLLESMAGGHVTSWHVEAGQSWTVPPGTFHRETALEDCIIIEISDPIREDRFRSGADYGGLRSMTDTEACVKLQEYAKALRGRAAECEGMMERILRDGLRGLNPEVPVEA